MADRRWVPMRTLATYSDVWMMEVTSSCNGLVLPKMTPNEMSTAAPAKPPSRTLEIRKTSSIEFTRGGRVGRVGYWGWSKSPIDSPKYTFIAFNRQWYLIETLFEPFLTMLKITDSVVYKVLSWQQSVSQLCSKF